MRSDAQLNMNESEKPKENEIKKESNIFEQMLDPDFSMDDRDL